MENKKIKTVCYKIIKLTLLVEAEVLGLGVVGDEEAVGFALGKKVDRAARGNEGTKEESGAAFQRKLPKDGRN